MANDDDGLSAELAQSLDLGEGEGRERMVRTLLGVVGSEDAEFARELLAARGWQLEASVKDYLTLVGESSPVPHHPPAELSRNDVEALLAALEIPFHPRSSTADLRSLLHSSQQGAAADSAADLPDHPGTGAPQPAARASAAAAGKVIVLKRGTPANPHYVPLSEYNNAAKTVGAACWELTQPPSAIAACWQIHARDLGGAELDAKWREAASGYQMPAGNCTAPFTQARGFKFLVDIPGDGDCFYNSVCAALETIGVGVTVEELRKVAASKMTQDLLEMARIDPPAELEGHLDTLDDFRARVREPGGAWADDVAIAAVIQYLRLAAILLIDVEAPKGHKYDRVRLDRIE